MAKSKSKSKSVEEYLASLKPTAREIDLSNRKLKKI